MLRIVIMLTTLAGVAWYGPDPIRDRLEDRYGLTPTVYQHPLYTVPPTVPTPTPVRSVQITAPVIWADERRAPLPPATTLPTVFVKCPGLEVYADFAGWPQDRWPLLDRIAYAESRCRNVDRYSPTGRPVDRGILQVNQIHREWLAGYGIDWDDLLDPYTNFVAGLLIAEQAADWCDPWYMSGPWTC